MINVDEWAEIRRLYFAERMGIKTIARRAVGLWWIRDHVA